MLGAPTQRAGAVSFVLDGLRDDRGWRRRSTRRASRCAPATTARSRSCVGSAWRRRCARRLRCTTRRHDVDALRRRARPVRRPRADGRLPRLRVGNHLGVSMTVETSKAPATSWWSLTPEAAASELDDWARGAHLRRGGDAPREVRAQPAHRHQVGDASCSWRFKQVMDPMNLMLSGGGDHLASRSARSRPAILVALLVALQRRLRRAPRAEGASERRRARDHAGAAWCACTATARSSRCRHRELVPGDVVELEAGDIVPADARIVRASTLETQEASLTGESTPIEKSADALAGDAIVLGDRASMVYQNTSITRGTATGARGCHGHDHRDGRHRDDARRKWSACARRCRRNLARSPR